MIHLIEVKSTHPYAIPPELIGIIPGYLGRRDEDIAQLKLAASRNDYETIGKIAHKLKGNGASYGFDRLTEIGRVLMQTSETKNQLAVAQLIQEFEIEIQNIKTNIL